MNKEQREYEKIILHYKDKIDTFGKVQYGIINLIPAAFFGTLTKKEFPRELNFEKLTKHMSWEFITKHNDVPWSLETIYENPNIPREIFIKVLDNKNMYHKSQNPNVDYKILKNNQNLRWHVPSLLKKFRDTKEFYRRIIEKYNQYEEFCNIFSNNNLSDFFLEEYRQLEKYKMMYGSDLDGDFIFDKKHITHIKASLNMRKMFNMDPIEFNTYIFSAKNLFRNEHTIQEFLKVFGPDEYYWSNISRSKNISWSFITRTWNKYPWTLDIYSNPNLELKDLELCIQNQKLNSKCWSYISRNPNLTLKFVNKYESYIDFNTLSEPRPRPRQKGTYKNILKFFKLPEDIVNLIFEYY